VVLSQFTFRDTFVVCELTMLGSVFCGGADGGISHSKQQETLNLKTAVGGEVLREDVKVAGSCAHPDAHLAARGVDGATA
jgi:hypothetical protein